VILPPLVFPGLWLLPSKRFNFLMFVYIIWKQYFEPHMPTEHLRVLFNLINLSLPSPIPQAKPNYVLTFNNLHANEMNTRVF